MNSLAVSCCFTGHRPSKLPWGYREDDLRCLDLKMDIVQALVELYGRGYRHFLCGMAEGCDLYFAESVLMLRQVHSDVTLEAAVPFRGQAAPPSPRFTADACLFQTACLCVCLSLHVHFHLIIHKPLLSCLFYFFASLIMHLFP